MNTVRAEDEIIAYCQEIIWMRQEIDELKRIIACITNAIGGSITLGDREMKDLECSKIRLNISHDPDNHCSYLEVEVD